MNKLLYFNINYNCNSNCIFCAANFGMDEIHRGMPLKQFHDELSELGAGPGDRIVINGGEPTVHPEFLQFLKEARSKGCFIDLYTNGLKLADAKFTEKVVSFAPMLIRIPVFGASADKHDFLTGREGNFYKLMDAFSYLAFYDQSIDDFFIEVKLLLSKATVNENLAIIKLFEKKFPGHFYFSLNPLIASDKVAKHKDILVQSLEELVEESESLIDYALKKDILLDINLIPFCLVPEKFRHLLNIPAKEMPNEHYSDPHKKKTLQQKFETAKCLDCFYQMGCKGFPPHYFKLFSEESVKPISEPFHAL